MEQSQGSESAYAQDVTLVSSATADGEGSSFSVPQDAGAMVAAQPAESAGFRTVNDRNYAQRVLYSWTTVEQVAELRTAHRALVRTAHTTARGQQPSPFNRWLFTHRMGPSATAQISRLLVDDPVLMYRRYAWTSPYATSLGLGPRSYGTALIRLQLRANAYWLRLDPSQSGREFTAFDAQQQSVELTQVLAEPQRIAVVYHVRDRDRGRVPFREYVLCNEAMIEQWSVGTSEIAREIAAETELLSRLAQRAEPSQPWSIQSWRVLEDNASELSQYVATLAFDTPAYRWQPAALARMVRALSAYDPTPPELREPSNSVQNPQPNRSTQADSGL